MAFVQRFAVVGILVLAFAAVPLGALCSSCCPDAVKAPELGQAMPCCDEGCAPKVATAKPSAPGTPAESSRVNPPSLVVASVSPGFPPASASPDPSAFVSPSPPRSPGAFASVLRL